MEKSAKDPILTSMSDQVLTVSINRPEARNALRVSDKQRITAIVSEAATAGARCIVITGVGEHAFCAGSDLKEMAGMDIETCVAMQEAESEMYNSIMRSAIPVLAAVHGWALGTGCVLAAACDLVFADSSAKFGQPEILNGAPTPIHGALLPHVIGLNRARWLVLTGRTIDAVLAEQWGLVTRLTAENEALSSAVELATEMTRTIHPTSMALQKRIVDSWVRYPFDAAVAGSMYIAASSYGSQWPQSAAERMHGRELQETRAEL